MTESTDKAIEKLTGNIEQLIAAAKKIAPHAWETMVRQVILVNALQVLVWLVLCWVTWSLAKKCLRMYALDKESRSGLNEYESATLVVSGIVGVLFGIIALISLLFSGPSTVAALLNPEFAAAECLLQSVK